MHVALNAHLLSVGATYRGAGISRYTRNLLACLPSAGPDQTYTVYCGDPAVPRAIPHDGCLSFRVSRLPTVRPAVRIFWEQLVQPWELATGHTELLHSLGYVQPIWCPYPSVVTVQDLSFMVYPETFNRANRLYLQWMTDWTVRHADRVIVPSEHTKNDVGTFMRVPPDKVDVIPLGVEEMFRPVGDAERERFRRSRGLPEAFILFVGTLEPRKNVERLVRAYGQVKGRCGVRHKLVLVGGKGWLYDRIFATLGELGLQDDVIFAGYVPLDELPLWYNCAEVFAYPSLHEGFGFPPLEAMACGTPVVASATTSLPEVVGDAGLLVDPLDVDALEEGLARVLTDDGLRQELSRRGLARAGQFSWERAARETVETYRRTMANRGR